MIQGYTDRGLIKQLLCSFYLPHSTQSLSLGLFTHGRNLFPWKISHHHTILGGRRGGKGALNSTDRRPNCQ